MKSKSALIVASFLIACSTAALAKTYTVRSGDTLSRIAARNNITIAELKAANDLPAGRAGDMIHPGQVLVIPEFEEDDGLPQLTSTYTVSRGDYLSRIAKRFNTSVAWLKTTNGLTSDTIYIGQKLKVPGPGGEINVWATPVEFQGSRWNSRMSVSAADREVLARIVKGECDARVSRDGMVAVAAVVLNRVHSDSYPNTIPGVAHQKGHFSSYDRVRRQSHYYGRIPQYAWDAADAALSGEDPTHGSTVFFNPEIVRSGHEIWRVAARLQFVKRIGQKAWDSHVFYRVRPNRVLAQREAEREAERQRETQTPVSRDIPGASRRGMAGFSIGR